ncbi:MurR/RpiR family transcriptional regulator [Enterococcus sp. AZ109]|uniref:MurR/RpiR family transcriptional regulator n=1 Tax=Enterococcus sp. AZ109 TaxID=2774634 RepID=UPI003F21F26F
MLLIDRMKEYPFSPSEKVVIDFILEKEDLIRDYSVKAIAQETYTSPSILVRIAKKLNYSGWSEFKQNFLAEVSYLQRYFQSIDANYPFAATDSFMAIANKLGQLHLESIHDTLALVAHDSLYQAIRLMEKSSKIQVYAVDNLNYAGEEFVFKLGRLNVNATINPVSDNHFHDAAMSTSENCAICLSYSGETPTLLKSVKQLKKNQTPVIAITSIGKNSLADLADVVLPITTREKSYTKIAGFSSLSSISFMLDILYSCYFSLHYQQNMDYKVRIAERIETNRQIDNAIIKED